MDPSQQYYQWLAQHPDNLQNYTESSVQQSLSDTISDTVFNPVDADISMEIDGSPINVEPISDIECRSQQSSSDPIECNTSIDNFDDVSLYLMNQTYAPGMTKGQKANIRKKSKNFILINGALYYKKCNKNNLPDLNLKVITDPSEKKKIIERCHVPNGIDGHFGQKKTLSALSNTYYWLGQSNDVKKYVSTCKQCQEENPRMYKVGNALQSIPVPTEFFAQVGIDLIGTLKDTVDGYKYILTVCCYYTKWSDAIPIKDKRAITIAIELYKLMCRYGPANVFIHDQGSEFANQVNGELCRLMKVQRRMASAYHP